MQVIKLIDILSFSTYNFDISIKKSCARNSMRNHSVFWKLLHLYLLFNENIIGLKFIWNILKMVVKSSRNVDQLLYELLYE